MRGTLAVLLAHLILAACFGVLGGCASAESPEGLTWPSDRRKLLALGWLPTGRTLPYLPKRYGLAVIYLRHEATGEELGVLESAR